MSVHPPLSPTKTAATEFKRIPVLEKPRSNKWRVEKRNLSWIRKRSRPPLRQYLTLPNLDLWPPSPPPGEGRRAIPPISLSFFSIPPRPLFVLAAAVTLIDCCAQFGYWGKRRRRNI